MAEHFSVVVRLECPREDISGKENDPDTCKIVQGESKGVLQFLSEPHPSSITFNQVYPYSKSQEKEFHRNSLADLLNSVLEGFNGTVISLSDRSLSTLDAIQVPDRDIIRAAKHIFSTLKKLKKSGLSANLVIPCTFVVLNEETAYDLLYELPDLVHEENKTKKTPILQMFENHLVDVITSEAKGVSDVKKMLTHGKAQMNKYLESHNEESHCNCCTIFTIGVKFANFGASFAPISGTLSFVSVTSSISNINIEEILASTVDEIPSTKSINSFFRTIHNLSSGTTITLSDSPNASRTALKTSTTNQSILTDLLQEALGGNCKTLLVMNIPTLISSIEYHHYQSILELISKARNIENKPDKNELAKKALMDAYMTELRKLYGGNTSGEQNEKGEILHEMTSENKDAEIAAKALASAVRGRSNDKQNPVSESEESSDDEEISALSKSAHVTESSTKRPMRVSFTLAKKSHMMAGNLESSSSSSFYQKSDDLTIEALVGVIQDPDKGVPRARAGALDHVKIHRGKGDIFSGADIVTWLVNNVAGVENENDAEQIGQILLDKEAIFHSEGSSVFANSAYLFYYAREARPMGKMLTQEEIQSLLMHDKEPPKVQVLEVSDVSQNEQTKSRNIYSLEQSFNVEATITPAMTFERSNNTTNKPQTVTPANDTLQSENHKTQNYDFITSLPETLRHEQLLSIESTLVPSSIGTSTTHDSSSIGTSTAHDSSAIGTSTTHDSSSIATSTGHDSSSIGTSTTHDSSSITTSTTHDSSSIAANAIQGLEETDSDPNKMTSTSLQEQKEITKNEEEEDEQEIEQTPSHQRAPNLKAISRIPDLQTLEKYSDYPHPLHFQAATSNEAGVIKHLIHWYGVDQLDERDRTPLMFAALGNKAGSCKALLEHGSVPDRRDKGGLTAIHIACYHGHKEVLTTLVNKGANIAIRDKILHTAFHWSTVPESSHCLRILLRHSQKHSLEREEDKSGLTPIHWAIYYDHLEHLKLLNSRCTDLTRIDACGRTLATYSIQKDKLKCFEYLLKVCSSLAVTPDSNNLTPLHHASTNPSTKYLSIIINTLQATNNGKTMNFDVIDNYGRTPVHYAVLYGHSEILKLLLTHGANKCLTDKDGKTPLQLAKKYGVEHNETIKILLEGEIPDNTQPSNVGSSKEQSTVCILL